jgi:tetratricopeptide (TPR) repeat protein
MRATLDWSHDLLDEPERVLFRRLSVFAGGFSLTAAEAVGAAGEVCTEEVPELLGRLVEQSMVAAEVIGNEEARYGMLEPVRQYALDKLEDHEDIEEAHRRHAALFLALAERGSPELQGPQQVEWLERLERENGNLRVAMSWALRTGEVETAAQLGWALWPFWWVRGQHREGRRWMEMLLERNPPASLRTTALLVAGQMAYAHGGYEACKRYTSESLELAREMGDTARAAHAVHGLGLLALNDSDLDTARSRLEEAMNLHLERGDEQMISAIRTHLGTVLYLRGDLDDATAIMEEGLTVAQRSGDRVNTYVALYNLAQVDLARGVHDRAATFLLEGVKLSQEMRDQANLAYFLEGLGVIAGLQGETLRSARLFGVSERLLEEAGGSVYNYYKPDRSLYERTRSQVRTRLGEEVFEAARAEGHAMIFEEAIEYALVPDTEWSRGDSNH